MSDELTAIAAVRSLMAAGFRRFVIGDPDLPEALVYVRAGVGTRDLIQVHAAHECEAVRMVGRMMVRQIEGTTAEVVAAVLRWP